MPSFSSREYPASGGIMQSPGDKIPTGIERMDELMYGGYSRGDNILVYGGIYSQKKNYIYNFIAASIKRDTHVLILALDTPVDDIIDEIRKRDNDIEQHMRMLHIIDGFSRKYQEKMPENVIPLEDSYNFSRMIKTISGISAQYHPCAFVMLSATQYIMNGKDESIKFMHQLCYMRRNEDSVSIYVLDDFVGEKAVSELGYAMDVSIRFMDRGDDDYLRVSTLRDVRTRDEVKIYRNGASFYLGSFNVEKIK